MNNLFYYSYTLLRIIIYILLASKTKKAKNFKTEFFIQIFFFNFFI